MRRQTPTFVSWVVLSRMGFKQIVSCSELKGLRNQFNSGNRLVQYFIKSKLQDTNPHFIVLSSFFMKSVLLHQSALRLPCMLCSRCLLACYSQLLPAPPENDTAVSGCRLWNVCAEGRREKWWVPGHKVWFLPILSHRQGHIWTHHPAGIAKVSYLNLQLVGIQRLQGVY